MKFSKVFLAICLLAVTGCATAEAELPEAPATGDGLDFHGKLAHQSWIQSNHNTKQRIFFRGPWRPCLNRQGHRAQQVFLAAIDMVLTVQHSFLGAVEYGHHRWLIDGRHAGARHHQTRSS